MVINNNYILMEHKTEFQFESRLQKYVVIYHYIFLGCRYVILFSIGE